MMLLLLNNANILPRKKRWVNILIMNLEISSDHSDEEVSDT